MRGTAAKRLSQAQRRQRIRDAKPRVHGGLCPDCLEVVCACEEIYVKQNSVEYEEQETEEPGIVLWGDFNVPVKLYTVADQ